jgi:hypothetical protein
VLGDDDIDGGEIETPVAFVIDKVSEENTSGGPGYQFVSGFGREVRIGGATEYTQMHIEGGDSMEGKVWTCHADHLGREVV